MGHKGVRPGLMAMHNGNRRTDLAAHEKAVTGAQGDLVSEERVPARPRASTVMFSLRLDRPTFDALSELAEERGQTFSEAARDALRTYVGQPSKTKSGRPLHAIAEEVGLEPYDAGRSVRSAKGRLERIVTTWGDQDLEQALRSYERDCRQSHMKEKALRSYLDYAQRFLAWRKGDYTPRGTPISGRPVPARAVTTDDLRSQAKSYRQAVAMAGREQPTVETYFRHAMFFIRWLDGDFEPGARLTGLR